MNVWDILILAGIAVMAVMAVRQIRKGKAGGCSGTCSCCRQGCKKEYDSGCTQKKTGV